ncbi:alginate lyase family protein [Granulicella sp. WH15]|uniref:alginate lyase family protein n=1 Tax=Granulicella sp. WH15 TaxID=2602070 RepID=UPI00136714A6|nr:alginate lyase family protein [Granulicella sp. WH15]QHN03855.1 alginate lyase family protein [Granulicella sp. WH15]
MPTTRRAFVTLTTATLASTLLHAQSTHPDVALIDHDRILTAAREALSHQPNPSSTDSLLDLSLILPALAAAVTLTNDPALTKHAAAHLDAWFVSPATRMPPALNAPNPEDILEAIGLAEIAVAIPFLGIDTAPYLPWFASYLDWLMHDRTALLARDRKDHHASSWLLQSAACARLTANEPLLADLRHRFKTITIRAQIDATGLFPHELPTPNPYRNSLFNLDLLAGTAVLLSTRFDSLWEHELQDGPGLRAAIARHAPYIESRSTWPYPADQTHFHDLPCRRPALLFAARAYSRAPYAELWRSLTPAQPAAPELLRTFPIRQPLLWTTQPKAAI